MHAEGIVCARLDNAADYHPESCCRIATALAQLGNAADVDFCLALGINLPTFHSWRRVYPEFARAIEAPTTMSTDAIERSLLRSALGFDYNTDKVIRTREGEFVRTITKHHPPDINALEFALRARLPERYGTRPATEAFARTLFLLIKRITPAQTAASEDTVGDGVSDEICRVAYVMSGLSASDSEIAAALGVSLEEFNDLQKQPSLSEALNSGKELVDGALERALSRRAGGYQYEEGDIFCTREGDITRLRVSRHLTGDLKALELWLRAHPGD